MVAPPVRLYLSSFDSVDRGRRTADERQCRYSTDLPSRAWIECSVAQAMMLTIVCHLHTGTSSKGVSDEAYVASPGCPHAVPERYARRWHDLVALPTCGHAVRSS